MTTEMSKLVETQTGVRLRGVTKTYGSGDAEVHALRGVDVDVEPGKLGVVPGPSGSGKTTLLNLIGGLEPPQTAGRVVVCRPRADRPGRGAQLTAYRRDQIGFVFQFFNLMPRLTARENVEKWSSGWSGDAATGGGEPNPGGGRARPAGGTISRRGCPAVSSSGSRSPGRW